jgi:hypothetical protein
MNRQVTTGWGIHLVEGTDWPKFFAAGLIGFLISTLFGLVWSICKSDVQGGFGIAAYVGVFFTFTMGTVQTALQITRKTGLWT